MNGRHSISIAVLTDNQDDVQLINSTLRDAGHAAHCHWVASPKRLADTLATGDVELLILNCDRYADAIRQVLIEAGLPAKYLTAAVGELTVKRAPGAPQFEFTVQRGTYK